MADLNPARLYRAFVATPNERLGKTLGMAFVVSLVCALSVSSAAVWTRARRLANVEAARAAQFQATLRALPGVGELLSGQDAARLQARIVELDSGAFRSDVDPLEFDARAAAADPAQSVGIAPALDLARIGRRARLAAVYTLGDADAPRLWVLPVYGKGYQSTLRGQLVLQGDLRTILALSIHEHAETPGVGSRVTDASWLASFRGKQAFDAERRVAIDIVKGTAQGPYQVDAISGATRTSDGVRNLLRYWLGPHGYGPWLAQLAEDR